MDDFARGTRGLWSKASLKADAGWGPRRQAESVASRRSKLAEKVKELKTRTDEINKRMKGHDVARKHALDALAVEMDPFLALLERFDMECAEEESDYANRLWLKEEHCREQIVLRYRQTWAAHVATASPSAHGGKSSAANSRRGSRSLVSHSVQREDNATQSSAHPVTGPPRRAPVRRIDGKNLRGSEVRLVLLRMTRHPEDLAFQARSYERLLALAAWLPKCAHDCLHFGVLAKACHLLADVLHALGVHVPSFEGSHPGENSSTNSSSSSSSSSSTPGTAHRKKDREPPKCRPESEEEALALCRPIVGLMATLVLSDEIAGMQMDALSGYELAAATIGRFPLDESVQRHVCHLIRVRCGDDTGRTVAGSATGNINGLYGNSVREETAQNDGDDDGENDYDVDDGSSLGTATTLVEHIPHVGSTSTLLHQASLATSVSGRSEADYYNQMDFELGTWVDPSTGSYIPSPLSILVRVLALQLGLPLTCLRRQARALRQGAKEYLAAKPEKAIETRLGRAPLGTALTPAQAAVAQPGVGTTRIPWDLGEESMVALMEAQQRRRPANLPALHAALLALQAFATNSDENKADVLRCGALPLLLALLRAAGHIDRILLLRAGAAALCTQAMDVVRALLWTPSADAPSSTVAFEVASQVVAAGGVCRMVEAVKVHHQDPKVATAMLQLLQALMAALAPGPPPTLTSANGAAAGAGACVARGSGGTTAMGGGFSLGFAFESGGGATASPHAWHLRHCGGGSKVHLAMLLDALKQWSVFSPIVWLAATNLATLMSGSTELVQGNIQSALMSLHGPTTLVQCLAVNLYDPHVAEALCRVMYFIVACGPRGNLLRNELKGIRAADELFKCSTVHAGANGRVLHWAGAASEIILRRMHE